MVSNEDLIATAHELHKLLSEMNACFNCNLIGIDDDSVHLGSHEFHSRFPDRSAWTFEPWEDDAEYAGKLSVTIQGVKFFALELRRRKSK